MKDEEKKELEKVREICRQLKKSLKLRSKSQLIELVIAYTSDLQQLQEVSRQLHEEVKELRELVPKQKVKDE